VEADTGVMNSMQQVDSSASAAMSLDRDAGFAYSGAATRPQVDTPFYVARYTYRKYMA